MGFFTMKNGIDLPVMQQLAPMYSSNYHGSCFVSDEVRYIYWLQGYGTTNLFRYDVFTDGWEQLASSPVSPSSSGYASSMVYDFSRKRIYAVFGNSTSFYYYDLEANAWSTVLALLPVACDAGGWLEHTCPYLDPTGNDDYFYYMVGVSSSRKLYRYSVTGNAWIEMGTDIIPSAPSAGCGVIWAVGINPDWLFIFRGSSTRTVYIYSISGNNIVATQEIKGSGAGFGAGSIFSLMFSTGELFWIESGSRNILKTKLKLTPQETGTATGSTATTLVDATKSYEDDFWFRAYVTITSGTGAGQTRQILGNSKDSLEVYPAWSVNPDNTSQYEIKNCVFDYGSMTAMTTTTITDSSKTWLVNGYANLQVKIIAGTGAGQLRYITANTANQLTVSVAWGTNPDATSKFEIIGFKTFTETLIPYNASASYYGNTMCTFKVKGFPFVFFSRKNAQTDWFKYLTISP